MGDSMTTCDEIIDADAEAKSNRETKSNNEEKISVSANFNLKKYNL